MHPLRGLGAALAALAVAAGAPEAPQAWLAEPEVDTAGLCLLQRVEGSARLGSGSGGAVRGFQASATWHGPEAATQAPEPALAAKAVTPVVLQQHEAPTARGPARAVDDQLAAATPAALVKTAAAPGGAESAQDTKGGEEAAHGGKQAAQADEQAALADAFMAAAIEEDVASKSVVSLAEGAAAALAEDGAEKGEASATEMAPDDATSENGSSSALEAEAAVQAAPQAEEQPEAQMELDERGEAQELQARRDEEPATVETPEGRASAQPHLHSSLVLDLAKSFEHRRGVPASNRTADAQITQAPRNLYGSSMGMGGMRGAGIMSLFGAMPMWLMFVMMGMSGTILAMGSKCFEAFWKFVTSYLWSEVDVEQTSEAYKWLEFWITEQEDLHDASTRCQLKLSKEVGPQLTSNRIPFNAAETADAGDSCKGDRHLPRYLPRDGEQVRVNFQDSMLWIQKVCNEGQGGSGNPSYPQAKERSLRICTPLSSKDIVSKLVLAARAQYQDRLKTHTVIWSVAGGSGRPRWRALQARPSRPMDTVVLEGTVAHDICADVRQFISSEQWYYARGVPYRRGYLLYGPPGCGKTSFITALAGELHMVICIVNLASKELTDDALVELLSEAPRHSILLLEDVDAAFKRRDTPPPPPGPPQKDFFGITARHNADSGITFSGLLNAIDGVAAQEGKVLFLTTNHVDQLDDALVRPGRVDVRAYFGLASQPCAKRLFLRFYQGLDTDQTRLMAQAEEFAAQLPEGKFAPATLQGHLMNYRSSPQQALDHLHLLLTPAARTGSGSGTNTPPPEADNAATTAESSEQPATESTQVAVSTCPESLDTDAKEVSDAGGAAAESQAEAAQT